MISKQLSMKSLKTTRFLLVVEMTGEKQAAVFAKASIFAKASPRQDTGPGKAVREKARGQMADVGGQKTQPTSHESYAVPRR